MAKFETVPIGELTGFQPSSYRSWRSTGRSSRSSRPTRAAG